MACDPLGGPEASRRACGLEAMVPQALEKRDLRKKMDRFAK
jgi:hypothetical protein